MKKKKNLVKQTLLYTSAALAVFLLAAVCVKGKLATKSGEISTADGKVYAQNGAESTLADGEVLEGTYDFTFTTFNVGGFAAGIDDGIHTSATNYNGLDAVNNWKLLLDYENGYQNHNLKSDFYFFQECSKTLWTDDANKLAAPDTSTTVMRNDVFSKVFKNLYDYTGIMSGTWGAGNNNLVMASNTFEVRDITYGTLSGKYEENRRGYMKGYIDVNGVEIAVYNMHLGWNDNHGDVVVDSYYELIDLMNEDEYVIVAGDMNGSSLAEYMIAAGYKAANRGDFGSFNTTVNGAGYSYIDNIFVSPNIEIKNVSVGGHTAIERGYSDHYPLTVYLKINKGVAGVTPKEQLEVGKDGFTTEYR